MMSSGFMYWYDSLWEESDVHQWVSSLEAAGWLLEHPDRGGVTVVNSAGEFETISRVEIVSVLLDLDDGTAMDWWLDADSTVDYFGHRFGISGVRHHLWFDGLGVQVPRVERDVLGLITSRPVTTQGLVIDHWGDSDSFDWDSFVEGADMPLDYIPEVIGLRPDVDRRHPELAHYPTRRIGGLIVHDRAGVLFQ